MEYFKDKEIVFRSDTKHRKQWFTGLSFSHPAKMTLPLQLYLIDRYTQPGDIILDPMAGSGTLLVACSLGRHVICVELEQKFVDMQKGNWGKIQQRGPQMGYQMGTATILQGDARNLSGLLVDKIITSPPYGGILEKPLKEGQSRGIRGHQRQDSNSNTFWQGGYSEAPDNIGNLPYGSIDQIVTSPPYEEALGDKHHSPRADKLAQEKSNPVTYTDRVDSIITSPPYEGSVSAGAGGEREGEQNARRERLIEQGYEPKEFLGGKARVCGVDWQYSDQQENIGNLKSGSYLEAMQQVYSECFKVLKPGGLLVLVLKNFIRQRQIVRLDLDTIKLCDSVGFTMVERLARRLTQQSFWRVIYRQKFPDAPTIHCEDVLVFEKVKEG